MYVSYITINTTYILEYIDKSETSTIFLFSFLHYSNDTVFIKKIKYKLEKVRFFA